MRDLRHLFLPLALTASPAAAQIPITTPITTPITAPGPNGPLAGTLLGEGKGRPVVLIVPGSGPTDRDGNSPMGAPASYRLLAESLAAQGVATVRIDKRGLFGSKAAVPDPNAVTIADYAADVHAWAKAVRVRTGARCIWVLGHSEGGLVALTAAQAPADLCGLILVAAPGRPVGVALREQFRANPANAPLLPQVEATLTAYETGGKVDYGQLHPALARVFVPQLDGYWRSLLGYDPTRLIAAYAGKVLIVQGTRDIQVSVANARALAAAQPHAVLALVNGANHVLKHVATDDRQANLATYGDPSLPLADGIVAPIAALVEGR